jgi:hypothetical protein
VDQAEGRIRQHADFDPAADQRVIQRPIAGQGRRRHRFRQARAPAAPQGGLRRRGGGHVLRVDVGVADDADRPVDLRQRLAGHLEQAGAEVAGDPVISHRAGQPLVQEYPSDPAHSRPSPQTLRF